MIKMDASMSFDEKIIQFDSIWMSNFAQFKFSEIGYSSGEVGDGMKRQKFVLGSGPMSVLVRVFLLKDCDWLKHREDFDWLENDVGD